MFVLPFMTINFVYLAAAVLPALYLMWRVYQLDKAEPEPPRFLARLFLMGAISTVPAIVLEMVGQNYILPAIPFNNYTQYYIALAVMVGLVEEGVKLFFLYRTSWNDPNFNYRFDAVVYAVAVSLGFAALENIEYVFSYGLGVAVSRALLAVPAHFAFAVFMGIWYGSAKAQEVRGNLSAVRRHIFTGYLMAVFHHAVYDAAAMIGTDAATVVFFAFVVLMDVTIIRKLRSESQNDQFIY